MRCLARSASTQSLPLRQGSYRDAVLRSDEKQTISRADSRPTLLLSLTFQNQKAWPDTIEQAKEFHDLAHEPEKSRG